MHKFFLSALKSEAQVLVAGNGRKDAVGQWRGNFDMIWQWLLGKRTETWLID